MGSSGNQIALAAATKVARMNANERLVTPGYKPLLSLPGHQPGLLQRGNLDINARPVVRNRNGSASTVRTITVTDNLGRAYLLPTVVNDAVVGNRQAIKHWQRTGQHLGVFKNEAAADAYAERLHNQQARFFGL